MSPEDHAAWVRQLRAILDAVAEALRLLGIARDAVGVSDAIHGGAAKTAEEAVASIVKLVRDANELASRLGVSGLTVPGDKPEVDLRPWWSRLLDKVSSTGRRNTAGEQLETLRLEADAALIHAGRDNVAAP